MLGFDQSVAQLAPQLMDVHGHGIAFDGAAAAVDGDFQLIAADGVAHALHQGQQRVVFVGAQIHLVAALRHRAACRFQHNVPAPQRRHHAVAAAPEHGAHPGQQFVQLEWLHQVVVGAGVQSLDAVAQAVARGDDQHRRRVEPGAQRLEQCQAAAVGQAQVKQNGLITVVHERQVRFGHVVRPVHVGAVLNQARAQGIAQHAIVFYQQDTQASSRPVSSSAAGALKNY
ncbi:hypothetical protein G6F68_013074 [Rhizopus microsporus]|nr:hypothetical protein G6F68_013074 [Rhizopus microsporus]